MTRLSDIFNISYGNGLDKNKMIEVKRGDIPSVNFVSRTSKNLGVVAVVRRIEGKEPNPKGSITTALGGSILCSFVQPEPFYTAQNIAVLQSKRKMSFQEKMFYCRCIEKNRFRYSTFGREANRTLKDLEIPSKIPEWVEKIKIEEEIDVSKPFDSIKLKLTDRKWKLFRYDELFDIQKGKRITNSQMKKGRIPCIRPIDKNNGVFKFIDIKPNHLGNTITINYNGSIGEAFYQPVDYFALDDINVLYPNNDIYPDFKLNPFIAIFLITLIHKEKYRFNYGRKWHLERMNESIIRLPVDKKGEPDWQFMEDYIKSLKYSKALDN